jgi:flavin reductase (DIM6/NTAB) family NADH-FMN oxidoreductase RutF
MAVTPEEFRAVLSAHATGVTVVTAVGPGGPSGATANGSRTLTSVRAQGRFGVNALAAGQAELARRFSAKDPEPEKWHGVEWSEHEELPRLEGALVWVACELRDLIDGGDHLILTGNVLEAESGEGQPLLFHRGDYRDLLAES